MACVMIGMGLFAFRTWYPPAIIFGGMLLFSVLFRWHQK